MTARESISTPPASWRKRRTIPRKRRCLPHIQSALTLQNEMNSGRRGLPWFGGGPGFPFPGPDFFDDFDLDDDDDDLDDDDFGPEPIAEATPSRQAREVEGPQEKVTAP